MSHGAPSPSGNVKAPPPHPTPPIYTYTHADRTANRQACACSPLPASCRCGFFSIFDFIFGCVQRLLLFIAAAVTARAAPSCLLTAKLRRLPPQGRHRRPSPPPSSPPASHIPLPRLKPQDWQPHFFGDILRFQGRAVLRASVPTVRLLPSALWFLSATIPVVRPDVRSSRCLFRSWLRGKIKSSDSRRVC